MIALHEDQVLDNLVRVKMGLMPLHIEYTQFTGTVVANVSSAITHTAVDPPDKGITDTLQLGAFSVGGNNTMQLVGKPVVNNPKVYEAYEEFANSDHFECDGEAPPSRKVHGGFIRKYGDIYCYVSSVPQSIEGFQKLSITTTLLFDAKTSAKTNYSVTIQGAFVETNDSVNEAVDGGRINSLVLLLSPKVPKSVGHIEIDVREYGARKFNVFLFEGSCGDDDKYAFEGEPTSCIRIAYTLDPTKGLLITPQELQDKVIGQSAVFQPDIGSFFTDESSVDQLRESIELLRLDELRN